MGVGLLGLLLLFGVCFWTSRDDPAMRELARLRRIQGWLGYQETLALFRGRSWLTRLGLERRMRRRADRLERTLFESGDLVTLTIWMPNLAANRSEVFRRLADIARDRPTRLVSWRPVDTDLLILECAPGEVGPLQAEFHSGITNRVPLGKLCWLAGNRDETVCRLPQGDIGDVTRCWESMNASVAEGWSLGVAFECGHGYRRILVARRGPAGETGRPGELPKHSDAGHAGAEEPERR